MKKETTNNSVYFISDNMASDIVVGLDIGTTKIATIIGYQGDHKIDIIGYGKGDPTGVQHGLLYNINKTVDGINVSKEQAEKHTDCFKVNKVFVGVSGRHFKSFEYKHVLTRINGKNSVIKQEEIDRMLNDLYNISVPSGERITMVIPQHYVVDKKIDTTEPVGMLGEMIEGYFQLITGNESEIKKILLCIENAGLKVEDIILEPIASGLSCLSEEEKNQGVALVDIGGGTTDLAIYYDGRPVFTKVIPIGGAIITRDIATVCKIAEELAEKLKITCGTCIVEKSNSNHYITLPQFPAAQPSQQINETYLAKIINMRVQNDILDQVKREIESSGYADKLRAGVVLTGGGATLRHIKELCQYTLQKPVRIGIPEYGFVSNIPNDLKHPMYATALGLLKYGIMKNKQEEEDGDDTSQEVEEQPVVKSQETKKRRPEGSVACVQVQHTWFQETVSSILSNCLESFNSVGSEILSPKGDASCSDYSPSSRSPKQNKLKKLKELSLHLFSNSHQEEVDIYAPSAVKPNTAFIVQLFIHDDSSSTDSISLQAAKIDPDTQHRTTEALSIAIKKKDRITVEFTSFSDQQDCIIIDESQKTKVWVGKQTHFQFNVMVTDKFRASSFVGKLKIEVNREPVGECSFKILIQNKFNTTPADVSLVLRNSQTERQDKLSELKQQLENNLKALLTQAKEIPDSKGDSLLTKNIETCKLCIQVLENPIPTYNIRRPRKVFVSSTCEDFMTQFRETVRKTILELKMVPEMCDDWPQSGYHPTHVCCQKVMESDIFIGLFGGRYGYIEPSLNSSMTQMEYMTALSANKKILVFVINPLNKTNEPDDIRQLQYDFIKSIEHSRILSKFKDSQDLHQKAKNDLLDIISAY